MFKNNRKCILENNKMRFQAMTQMSQQEAWKRHVVQRHSFLLDDIQWEKMKLQKNVVLFAAVKRGKPSHSFNVSIGYESTTVC